MLSIILYIEQIKNIFSNIILETVCSIISTKKVVRAKLSLHNQYVY